jgi:predicted lipoprotein with Yx(FWY)xxD motif
MSSPTVTTRNPNLSRRPVRVVETVLTVGVVLAVVLGLAGACSSSSSDSNDAASGDASETSTTTSPPGGGTTLGSIPSGTATVDVGTTDLGQVLVDLTGRTLYVFLADSAGTPTCVDESCTEVWPPLVGSAIAVGAGVPTQPGEFKLVARPDGTQQLSVDGQPLYTYSGDALPGETKGQGVGGQWFVVGLDGQPIRS